MRPEGKGSVAMERFEEQGNETGMQRFCSDETV